MDRLFNRFYRMCIALQYTHSWLHLSFHGIEYKPHEHRYLNSPMGRVNEVWNSIVTSHKWRLAPGFGKDGTDHKNSRVEGGSEQNTWLSCTHPTYPWQSRRSRLFFQLEASDTAQSNPFR